MMKTLILAINSKYIHAALAPWYLKAAVRAYNEASVTLSVPSRFSQSSSGSRLIETHRGKKIFLQPKNFLLRRYNEASVSFTKPLRFSQPSSGSRLQSRLNPGRILLKEPEIFETNINRPAAEILTEIQQRQPELLAICCYIWNMTLVEELLAELPRLLPNCLIVLGGPEVSFNGQERLKELPMVDYVVCGEGEGPFVELLSLLARHSGCRAAADLAAIPGLAWRKGGLALQNPVAEAKGEPPDPFLPEYMEQLAGRMVYTETTRGCPFSCGFCLSGRRGNVRYFDLERAKGNLLKLAGSGSKTIKLVDRTFNCHPARSREIIRFLLAARNSGQIPADVCFHFEVAADLFDEETIELLQKAPDGLIQMEVGLQSFQEQTLAAVSRKTDLRKVKENFRELKKGNNIHLHLDLIAGLPEEDYETFGCSFDQAFDLQPHMLQLGFLKLLHGSRLRKQSSRYGIEFDARPPYTVRRTNWLNEADLAALKLCEDALDRLYNSGRFPTTINYLLAAGQVRPFQLFSDIGCFIGSSVGMALETYIEAILEFGGRLPGVEKATLRDCLVIDWLQTNHVGLLPRCLQVEDPLNGRVGRILERLDKQKGIASSPALGTRRRYGFGLLYGRNQVRVALADYCRPRPFLGNYPLKILDINEVISG